MKPGMLSIHNSVLSAALLSTLCLFFFSGCGADSVGAGASDSQDPNVHSVQIHCMDGNVEELTVANAEELAGLLTAISVPQGWYSCSWQNGEGQVFLAEDTLQIPEVLYQNTAIRFSDREDRKPFVFAQEDGSFSLSEPILRSDLAILFGALLEDPGITDYPFADENSASSTWLHGASLMQWYGMLFGNRFFPDSPVSYGELFYYLSFCFPKAQGQYTFSDITPAHDYYPAMCIAAEQGWLESSTTQNGVNDPVLLQDFIVLVNRLLGRSSQIQQMPEQIRALLRNYSDSPELLCALADASIAHTDGPDGAWSSYSVVSKLSPGFHFDNHRLSHVNVDGFYTVSGWSQGLLFDENGYYTSGNPELDDIVQRALDEILTEEMTPEEQLKAVYQYTVQNFGIGGAYDYDWGTEDWWQESALMMLQRGRGNCYSFAAAFCALSRPLGYNTHVTSGQTFGSGTHGWAYIFIDGEEHIFDPQSENRYHRNMYNMSPKRWKGFEYDPVYQTESETPYAISQA